MPMLKTKWSNTFTAIPRNFQYNLFIHIVWSCCGKSLDIWPNCSATKYTHNVSFVQRISFLTIIIHYKCLFSITFRHKILLARAIHIFHIFFWKNKTAHQPVDGMRALYLANLRSVCFHTESRYLHFNTTHTYTKCFEFTISSAKASRCMLCQKEYVRISASKHKLLTYSIERRSWKIERNPHKHIRTESYS